MITVRYVPPPVRPLPLLPLPLSQPSRYQTIQHLLCHQIPGICYKLFMVRSYFNVCLSRIPESFQCALTAVVNDLL
jgi:hypothetical protein